MTMATVADWPIEEDVHYPPPNDIPDLVAGDVSLRLREIQPALPDARWAAALLFDIIDELSGETAGYIHLRLADLPELIYHGGHIRYGVLEAYRGRRYAAKALHMLLPIARRCGMNILWITCEPDNKASRQTIELAGGQLEEIRAIAESSSMYQQGRRLSCRYWISL